MIAPKSRVRKSVRKKNSSRAGYVTEARVARIAEVCGVASKGWTQADKRLVARYVDRCRHPYGKAIHTNVKGAAIITRDMWRQFTPKQITFLKATVFDSSHVYDHKNGIAKDWKLRARVLAELSAMDSNYTPELSTLQYENGAPVKRLQATRKSKDSLSGIPAACPVDMFALQHLHSALNQWIEYTDGVIDERPNILAKEVSDKESDYKDLSKADRKVELSHWLGRARGEAVRVMQLAHSEQYTGMLPQTFVEAEAGRWFAEGFSLQSCTKVVRKAALHGCYQFDIEACHHAILHKIAQDAGIRTPTLYKYVQDRKAVRNKLAREIGVSISTVKEVLIATIYGAQKSSWPRSALFQALGDAQDKAFQTPLFVQLSNEIRSALRFVTDAAGGYEQIRNPKGKVVSASDIRTNGQAIAFQVQGYEGLCLEAALKVHGSAVLSLHDGWVCLDKESARIAEVAILEATGFPLKVEMERYCLSGFDDIDTSQGSLLLTG